MEFWPLNKKSISSYSGSEWAIQRYACMVYGLFWVKDKKDPVGSGETSALIPELPGKILIKGLVYNERLSDITHV